MEMRNGLPDGRATAYHPNGTIENQGPYKAGNKNGLFHYWNDQGMWLKQELYLEDTLRWSSTDQSLSPPEGLVLESPANKTGRSLETPVARKSQSGEALPTPPSTRFLNGLPSHGSFAQLSLGSGSAIPDSSAQRLKVQGSYADGQLGGSIAIAVARFDDDFTSAWGRPVADLQVSYLIPWSTGVFLARAGVVLPLGNDTNRAALATAAGVVQAPNDVVYALPSTLGTRSSLSWFGSSEYVFSQIDFGVDMGLFGYSPGVHPVFHANAALGLGLKRLFVAAEGSTAIGWTGSASDIGVAGAALYASAFDSTIGVFVGTQDDRLVFRGRVAYDF